MCKYAGCLLFALAHVAINTEAAIQKMGELSPYYENLLSFERGTAITSPSQAYPGFDLRTMVDAVKFPGPEKGTFIFADVKQREVFTIDFGASYDGGLVVIRTHIGEGGIYGDVDHRRAPTMTIEASPDGTKWRMLRAWKEPGSVPRKQSVVWDDQPTRYLRIDLGDNDDGVGSRIADVSLFRRYKLPSLTERLSDIDALLRADLPELAAYRDAREKGDNLTAIGVLRTYFSKSAFEVAAFEDKDGQYIADWPKNIVRWHKQSWQIPGDRYDWYFFPCDLSDQPAHGWIAGSRFFNMPNYFKYHRDPKYAQAAAHMIREWMTDVPCPGQHRIPIGTNWEIVPGWAAITMAERIVGLAKSLVAFAPLREEFDDDTWINVLYGLWEHAAYLAEVTPELGGNWLSWSTERMLLIAREFPEFTDGKHWQEVALNNFATVVRRDVTESGKECEDSTQYCLWAMRQIIGLFEEFAKAGVSLPQDVADRMGKVLEFPAWVVQPDFRNPGIGDMGGVNRPPGC